MNAKLVWLMAAVLLISVWIVALTTRYQVTQTGPAGLAVRYDRWTGRSWMLTIYGWKDVKEPNFFDQVNEPAAAVPQPAGWVPPEVRER